MLLFPCNALFFNKKGENIMERRKDNKGRVLRTGESQRQDGRYCYRYKDLDGKRKYIYDLDLNSLREKEKQINRDIDDKVYSNDITMNDCFDRYMSVKTDLRDGTRHGYNVEYDRWIRGTWFGNKKISLIKKSDVLLFYKEKSEKLSSGTIRCLHKYIHPALEMAVEDDLIRKNPSNNCIKDYMENKPMEAMTKDQTLKFIEYAENYQYGSGYLLAVKIMLGTGLRVGEVTGMTWDDVDFKSKTININKQFTLVSGGGKHEYHISEPKTKSGYRKIPMSDDVLELMKEHKTKTFFQSKKYGTNVDGYSGFVFHTRTGLPILPNRINDYLAKLVKSYNDEHEEKLPKISCHTMRHTFCTRMAELGINPKSLQYIMGHSSYKTTSDVYITETEEHASSEFERVLHQA